MHKLGQHTDISHHEIMLPPGTKLQLEYEEKIKNQIKKQTEIDKYNKEIHNIDPAFQTKQFSGNTVIVRMFKNDYINKSNLKDSDNITDEDIISLLPTAKIELETKGAQPCLVDNPLNYHKKGIICALSKDVIEKSKETIGFQLEIGQIVELADFSGDRYYLDKTQEDIKISADDVIRGKNPYPNFQGYFKTSPFNIEALVKT